MSRLAFALLRGGTIRPTASRWFGVGAPRRFWGISVVGLTSVSAIFFSLSSPAVAAHSIQELASIGPAGGNGAVSVTFVGASQDGARIFFETEESLVASDTDATCMSDGPGEPPEEGGTEPSRPCVDVYQRFEGATSLISTGPTSGTSAFDAEFVGASADGSQVFFETRQSLLSSDTDDALDVYKAAAGTTMQISTGPSGGNSNQYYASFADASQDGTRVFFETSEALVSSDTDTANDIYERSGGTTSLISIGPSGGNNAFAARLVGASSTGSGVFLETEEALVSSDTDGGCVADPDLNMPPGPCTEVYSRSGGTTSVASTGPTGGNGAFDSSLVATSRDGSRVIFSTAEALTSNDTDARFDLYQRTAGATTLLSTGPVGGNGAFDVSEASASADGSHVFFETEEALVSTDTDTRRDVYDRAGTATTLLSTGPAGGNGAFDADLEGRTPDGGRLFFSTSERLMSGDTDDHDDVYQRSGGTTTLISTGPGGGNGAFDATFGAVSSIGARVFFETRESVVSGDTDSEIDVYERSGSSTTQISTGPNGGNGAFAATLADISTDGLTAIIETREALVSGDLDSRVDVYAMRVAMPTPPSPCTHRFKPSDIFDFQGQMNNLPTAAVACLDAGTYGGEAIQKITNDRLTIRSTPGHLALLRFNLWITGEGPEQGDRITISYLSLAGTDAPTTPTVSVNADRVVFERMKVTNSYRPVSCFNSDGSLEGGPAYRLVIQTSVIYDCGAGPDQHGINLGSAESPTVVDNWIYENGGEGVRIGSATSDATLSNNVIADNCARGGGSCNGNVAFVEAGNTGLTHDNLVTNSTIAFPYSGSNATAVQVSGGGNLFVTNCAWRSDGTAGVSLPQPPFVVDYVTADPMFVDRTTPVHAWRNYRIPSDPNHPCTGKVPAPTSIQGP